MGEIVGAGLLSHVPTIMLPRKVRLALNEGRETSLVPGLERLRREVLDELRPDTFIVFDTHWFTTVEFAVTAHARRCGHYTSDELPRGIRSLPYDLAGDRTLARGIAAMVREHAGVPCTAVDDEHLPIHYPTINLAHYLDRGERWVSVSICQTARDRDFLAVGAALARAVEAAQERVVLLASGGMSHRFWPLAELGRHESSDPVHVRTPEAESGRPRPARVVGEGRPRRGNRRHGRVPRPSARGNVRALPDDGLRPRWPRVRRNRETVQRIRERGRYWSGPRLVRAPGGGMARGGSQVADAFRLARRVRRRRVRSSRSPSALRGGRSAAPP